MKRIVAIMLIGLIMLSLCSCGESDTAKLNRLNKEASEARQKAKEAQDDYNKLKNFNDKYGN